ncbi:MAG: hypothetical protein J6P40_02690 [Oscillospiraceae bacterium]|nr:hypothetical protein [Oscillospiraceae bacterium]
MFGYKITLHRVHDVVRIHEGTDSLRLVVDGDPMRMVAGLNKAQKMLSMISEDTTEEEKRTAAEYFAEVIFGKEQAQQLMEFYRDDSLCVINVCGTYFRDRLGKLITKAQKHAK